MKQYLLIIFNLFLFSNISFAQVDEAKSNAYFQTANIYFDQDKYDIAILYCDSAIIANTDNLEAYTYRGVCNFSLKEYDSAIEDFDLALILNPGYAEVYYYRGICKMELGAKDQACEDWYNAYNYGYKKVMSIIEENCDLQDSKEKKK
ncbi:MAG: hypothetical protein DRI86_01885 [Bacteroidetes bacterium]|nr:MAG: hypothetical protein DRI86_01885 [Bacteroidota bacterium]